MIHLDVTCDFAPLQIEGTIGGIHVYYRERHGYWTVGFSLESLDDAVGNPLTGGEAKNQYSKNEALQRIIEAYIEWVAVQLKVNQ